MKWLRNQSSSSLPSESSSSSSDSFLEMLQSFICGRQGAFTSTYFPSPSFDIRLRMQFTKLHPNQIEQDSVFYRDSTAISLTFKSTGLLCSKPMLPSLILLTPASLASQIHFCRLQPLDWYSLVMMEPGECFISLIQSPCVSASMKILDRYGSYSPVCSFFFTASTCTQVKMSKSPTDSFKYFLSLSSSSQGQPFSDSSYSDYSSRGVVNSSESGSLGTSASSPEAMRSWKTLVSLVAVIQTSFTLFSSVGISLFVVSLTRNRSRQLSWLASLEFLQLEMAMKLPAFSISMFQGYVPPLTVSKVSRNSGQHSTAWRLQSSFQLQYRPMVVRPSSSMFTGLISQASFSLKRRGVQETRYISRLI